MLYARNKIKSNTSCIATYGRWKTAAFWLFLFKFKNIATILFTPKTFAHIKNHQILGCSHTLSYAVHAANCLCRYVFCLQHIFQWVKMQPVMLTDPNSVQFSFLFYCSHLIIQTQGLHRLKRVDFSLVL